MIIKQALHGSVVRKVSSVVFNMITWKVEEHLESATAPGLFQLIESSGWMTSPAQEQTMWSSGSLFHLTDSLKRYKLEKRSLKEEKKTQKLNHLNGSFF